MRFSVDQEVFFLEVFEGILKIKSMVIVEITTGSHYNDGLIRYRGVVDKKTFETLSEKELYTSYEQAAVETQMQANELRRIGHSNE